MNHLFGDSRDVVKERYALRTPGGFVPSRLPGWNNCTAVVHLSPALGAGFSQWHVDLAKDGFGEGGTGEDELAVYVLDGGCSATLGRAAHSLDAGAFAYVPPQTAYQFQGRGLAARLLFFQKRYVPLPGQSRPEVMVGHENQVEAKPFLGHQGARLKVLLPDDLRFDMAVNIFTYQPGAALPLVETHIMEHGLVMLKGQGIYRLDCDWHPVREGDIIWMAPYCPQWFAAVGEAPASYIYYKDVNRAP
jgi:(S)-ureidoglycine aminohydrolase